MRVFELNQRSMWLWLLAACLPAACITSHEPPGVGGESHFLQYCDAQCGSGLDCIQGVCTRGCLVGRDSCSDLSTASVCTADGVEPGEAAVCDLACSSHRDCAGLSSSHRCESGFCRAPAAPAGGDTADPGNGGSGGSQPDVGGGSNADGGSGGSGGFPYPTDKVFECPANAPSETATVKRSLVQGDQLVLQVEYGGGCKTHSFAVCYEPSFRESYPVQTTLRLIHQGNDDACNALISAELRFDLKPLAEAYERTYLTKAGLVSSNYGLYAFGALSCEDRALGAASQVDFYERAVSRDCNTAADCTWASTDSLCGGSRCGTAASTVGALELAQWLEITNDTVCGDFKADGCLPPPGPRCAMPPQLACIERKCQEAL